MTYVCYYECDYCHRRLTGSPWSINDDLKEGDLSYDGKDGHICKDCRLKRMFSPMSEYAPGMDPANPPANIAAAIRREEISEPKEEK